LTYFHKFDMSIHKSHNELGNRVFRTFAQVHVCLNGSPVNTK
jgi:hypothetical protein